MNQVAKIQPSRMPLAPAIAKEFALEPTDWRVLVEQIFPLAKSPESVMMALAYCRKRDLDVFKKPVHIVPMWNSKLSKYVETVWPGIAEIRTTASRTGEYAGIDAVEFGPMQEREFAGTTGYDDKKKQITKTVRYPEWASVVVYRVVQGERCAYHAKVYWEETYASIGKTDVPNDMWAKRPRGQLDKCVEAAALRKAFPEELGNTYAAEEMEGRTIEIEPAAPPAPPPAPPAADHEPEVTDTPEPKGAEEPVDAEIVEGVEQDVAQLPAAESDALKEGLMKRLGTVKTTAALEEWAKSAGTAITTMQDADRQDLQREWDAVAAGLHEREQGDAENIISAG